MPLPSDPGKYGKIRGSHVNAAAALPTYTVASVPSASENKGRIIYVSNGAAGSPCLAFSNGTSWLRVLLGVAVAAT
jgi:hypothetical protein